MPHTAESTPSVFAADFDSSPPFVGWVASKPSPAENLPSVSLYFQALAARCLVAETSGEQDNMPGSRMDA
ncbi:hypothetical protein F442_19040 [Phytophthora nicotianae P10297]|uniref:Uncharacterized protein n=1 Tax=Phytophthora nicotianae P10297 TaxID=1317064 RepID=W2YCF1_PHYNI|nr:hypothetical protein F442_19040 [Phytophthora nicotianae P10297]